MSEGEDTSLVVLGTSLGQALGHINVLGWAGRCSGVGTIAPVVHHHCAIGVDFGGTPGHRGGSIGALVVLHSIILEGEHAQRSLEGVARVGNPSQLRYLSL